MRAGNLPVSDTLPGSHGYPATTAATAFTIRTPRVPVIHTGPLEAKMNVRICQNDCACECLCFPDVLGRYRECWCQEQLQDHQRKEHPHCSLKKGEQLVTVTNKDDCTCSSFFRNKPRVKEKK